MDLLYLVHYTHKDPSKWNELKCYGSSRDQFPGVYCVLHTLRTSSCKPVYPGKYQVVLPLSLLLRQDYHINIQDHNGIQSEHNTLFPSQFNTFYNLLHKGHAPLHEIVFHHPVPIHPCNDFPSQEELRLKPVLGFVDETIYTGTTVVPPSSIGWLQDIGVKCGHDKDAYPSSNEWKRILHSKF
jgi:hypothetical protein